jgi:histidinol-phosphate aminotransferase
MKFNLESILRENIKKLKPYSSARDEYKGAAGIFLDANENAFGAPLDLHTDSKTNRYPDPLQLAVKEKISRIKKIPAENIFLGNGSDEAIDILFRIFCRPGKDKAIICPPTYGMYEVSAAINDVGITRVNLLPEIFQLDVPGILKAIDADTKLFFVCCPNNPTGNGVKWQDIKTVLENFNGIVVVDEAYINFASYRSLVEELVSYPNLVVLQTLSKAWGLAGLRVGMAFASKEIIDIFNKVKAPYNVNILSQQLALEALEQEEKVAEWVDQILAERNALAVALAEFAFVKKVYPSEANFLLTKVTDATGLYNFLISKEIVVRDRSKMVLCEDCLRITVGTSEENKKLLQALAQYQ